MNTRAAKPSRGVVRYLAPVACVVMLGVGASACGSSTSSTDTGDSPGATTPAGATTPSVATSEAQSGGAGF